MPPSTRRTATSPPTGSSSSRRVTFADEQGNAVAATATSKKQQRVEERARLSAQKKALQEQQAAAKRAEKEEACRQEEEQKRVTEMEAELKRLCREKEVAELEKETQRRQAEEQQMEERRARMTTPELINETEIVREPYTPRTLQMMKMDEEQKNGPYEYSLSACLKAQNGQRAQHIWSNKIGGLHKKGSFDIHLLNIEVDRAMNDEGITEVADIVGWIKSVYSKATRQHYSMKELTIDESELRVESITTEQWKKYTGYVIDVTLIITGRVGLRRNIQEVDGPTQSPSHRRTRTDALEQSHTIVRDHNESLGDNSEKLITRWKCHDSTCGHKGRSRGYLAI